MPFLENLFVNSKERTDFFISLAVIGLFGLGILSYIQPDISSENFAEAAAVASEQVTTRVKGKKSILVRSKEVQQQEKQWVSELKRKKIENTSLAPALIQTKVEAVDSVIYSTYPEERSMVLVQENGDSVQSNEQLTDINASLEMDTVSTLAEQNTDSLNPAITTDSIANDPLKPTNLKKNAGDCAIFIGAFKSKINADLLLKELEKNEAYSPFSNYEKGYQVVGINVSCDEYKAKKLLAEIKQKYSVDAWFAPGEK